MPFAYSIVFILYYPVTVIGLEAFKGKDIKSVEIPSSITSIYSKAFYGCNALTVVKFLGYTRNIEANAFTSGKIAFSVPKEYLGDYTSSLASYKKTLVGFDTILGSDAHISVKLGNAFSSVVRKLPNTCVIGYFKNRVFYEL